MNTLHRSATALSAMLATHAWGHSGHGMPGGIHWHATDIAGLAVVIAGALLAIWLSRGE